MNDIRLPCHPLLVGMVLGMAVLLSGHWVVSYDGTFVVTMLLGLCVLFVAFLRLDHAMILMTFFMLFSPEIIVGHLPQRDIVVRVEDFFILFLSMYGMSQYLLLRRSSSFIKVPVNKYIWIYIILFTVSTLRGMITADLNLLKGLFYIIKYIEYFLVFFVTLYVLRHKDQVRLYIKALFFTFVCVNGYALFQVGHTQRVSAPFEGAGEPNTLGGYQVLMVAVAMGIFLQTKKLCWKVWMLLVVLLTVVPFLHTYSRASYMALLPMYLTFVWLCKKQRFGLIIMLGVVMAVGGVMLPQKVKDRVLYTFQPHYQATIETAEIFGIKLGPSASARIQRARQVIRKWKESPYLGYGITGLGFIDSQYVRTLGEMGLLGMMSFMALLLALFYYARHSYKVSTDPLLQGVAVGFAAGHIGMIVHALTANTYIILRIMEPYWFLAALVMAIPRLEAAYARSSSDSNLVTARNRDFLARAHGC